MAFGGSGGDTARPGLSVKAIEDKLAKLAGGLGVWRDGLAQFLGPDLSAQFGLITEPTKGGQEVDSPDQQRARVIWHLRRLIDAKNEEESRRSARIAFNITEFQPLQKMNKGEREKWGLANGHCGADSTVRFHTRQVIPDLAAQLTKKQPVPPPNELDAIIAEFRTEVEASESVGQTELPSAVRWRPIWPKLVKLVNESIFKAVVAGTVATILGTAVYAWINGSPQAQRPSKAEQPTLSESLKITPYSLGSPVMWNVVFPTDAKNIDRFLTQESYEPDADGDPFSAADLDAGAYLAGAAFIRLDIENFADREMTLFDITLGSLKREPVPLGAAIFVGPIGGDPPDYWPREIHFDLDEIPPMAKQQRGETTFVDFFKVERIGLRPGQKQTLLLILTTDRAAYSFDIEFHFELGGKRYTQTLKRNGQPFRVAANLCAHFQNSALEGAHYAAVRSNYPLPGGDPFAEGNDWSKLLQLHSLEPATACDQLGFK